MIASLSATLAGTLGERSMSLLLLVALAAAETCPEPVSISTLTEALGAAESAWLDLDDVGFRDRVNELAGLTLPCVGDVVEPSISGRYHRVLAVHLYTVGDEAQATASLRAARAADPGYDFSDQLLPVGHPLRDQWDALEDPETRRMPEPRAGSLVFDGVVGRDRPQDVPTVFQSLDASGRVTRTVYLGPQEPLPAYPAIPRRRNALLTCAGASVLTAGAMYGLSWSAHGALYEGAADPLTEAPRLDQLRGRTNALAVTSGLILTAGVGCGTSAVLVGER